MSTVNGFDQYIKEFKFEEEKWYQHKLIKTYVENQAKIMNQAVRGLHESNFWEIIPQILGIDSKLVLLRKLLVSIDNFGLTDEQVLEIVEKDYLSYNKELCGYKLNDFTNHSLIFKVK